MSCPIARHFLKLLWDVDSFGAHIFNINLTIIAFVIPHFINGILLKLKKKLKINFRKCVCRLPNYLSLNIHALDYIFQKLVHIILTGAVLSCFTFCP